MDDGFKEDFSTIIGDTKGILSMTRAHQRISAEDTRVMDSNSRSSCISNSTLLKGLLNETDEQWSVHDAFNEVWSAQHFWER